MIINHNMETFYETYLAETTNQKTNSFLNMEFENRKVTLPKGMTRAAMFAFLAELLIV